MATKKDIDGYTVKVTGAGVAVEKPVDESVARQIMSLVMGGASHAEHSKLGQDTVTGSGLPIDASTPKAFMAGKRPSTDMEKVTCLAFYLGKHRNTATFKTRELTDLNTEAAQPKLSNASATARNAVTQGLLSLAGRGQKQITTRGEALVEALPDREKVQVALEAHPIRKPRKRRKSRKTKGAS
jgi:hypothetical protein